MNTNFENIKPPGTDQRASISSSSANISRLDFIKKLTLLTGVIITGCTPVRILLKSYPDKYDYDKEMGRQIMDAFVLTVIPGANPDDPDLSRIFNDEYYKFSKYLGFFISDLCSKSKQLFNIENFSNLTPLQRTKVIQSGLKDDSTTAKLYTGAIYMTQVSYYSCIYNDEKALELIDYNGSYGFMDADMFYNNSDKLLADEITFSGNYS
ncbi:MAG: hypothetical protein BMS9Abin39_0687 [Ignavibacteria bacterium]|nr:MAG: hypothetical protein BMS9Abin39_0687 [Ignavibacteria bacterium]